MNAKTRAELAEKIIRLVNGELASGSIRAVAKEIQTAEREAMEECAKIAEMKRGDWANGVYKESVGGRAACKSILEAIRALIEKGEE